MCIVANMSKLWMTARNEKEECEAIVVLPPAKAKTESWVVAVIFQC